MYGQLPNFKSQKRACNTLSDETMLDKIFVGHNFSSDIIFCRLKISSLLSLLYYCSL